ncbi:hypothetical protein ACLTEW_25875 [Gordonia lacunae]|uniref:hypothetical protein n=1 Tax=Gordonia lacunae TaxID=417102 RepID=UPI0039E503C1
MIRTRPLPALLKITALTGHLYAPVRLDLPRTAHLGIAAWYSDIDWMMQLQIAYDLYYDQLRPAVADRKGRGGVSKSAVIKVAAARAAAADWDTGRNSRLSVKTIMARTALGERTVQRATTLLKLLGAATEVLRGRQRTYRERMASWRKGDKGRGWASVYALHPPNNPQVRRAKLAADPLATPHPRRGPRRGPSSVPETSLTPSGKAGQCKSRASRDARNRGSRPSGRPRSFRVDSKGLLLAHRWLHAAESPHWVSNCTPRRWAAVLAKPAAHGWTPADLDQLLRDHVSLGGWIATTPADPPRLIGWLLKKHGDFQDRPAAAEEAREHEYRQAAITRRDAIARCTYCGDDGFRELGDSLVERCDHSPT